MAAMLRIIELAKAILSRDESQIEYYAKITRDMVGRVLRSHGIVAKDGRAFRLLGFDLLTAGPARTTDSVMSGET